MEAKQINSNYHILYNMIKDLRPYEEIPKEEILPLIKDLFNEYSEYKSVFDDNGSFGIEYLTIGDDSRYSDKHTQFFETEKERDHVFDDWKKELYYDPIFEQHLIYPIPHPNFHNAVKIVKVNGKIYKE